MSGEDGLLKLEAPSVRGDRESVEDSWWQEEQESDKNGSDSSSSGSHESFRGVQNTSSKGHRVSFFSSKSESSEDDDSVLQFGDLLDTEVQVLYFTTLIKPFRKGKYIAATLKSADPTFTN